MKRLYAPFNRNHDRIVAMDVRSAELTKYAANAMLATKISFMNEMANIAERVGADIEMVRHGIGSDPRIGYPSSIPGAGYGGSCFPKDVQALERTARQHGYDAQLLRGGGSGQRAPEAPAVRADAQRHFGGERCAARPSRSGAWPSSPTPTTCAKPPAARCWQQLWDAGAQGARLRSGGDGRGAAHLSASATTWCWATRRRRARRRRRAGRGDRVEGSSAARISRSSSRALKRPVMFDGRNIYDPAKSKPRGWPTTASAAGAPSSPN